MTVAAYHRTLTESAMRAAITEAVERQGGRVFWVSDSRYAPAMADFPDLVILLPPRAIFVELKSWRRTVTDGQRAVLDLLCECPRTEAFVVRSDPRDATEIGYQQFLEWLA